MKEILHIRFNIHTAQLSNIVQIRTFCVKFIPSSNDSENIKLILHIIRVLRLPLAVKTDFDDQWFHFDYKSHK